MNAARHFQALRFPWHFNMRSPYFLMPPNSALEAELRPLKGGFLYGIKQTMQAVIENDCKFLSSVLEPRLYSEYFDGLRTLERRGHTLSMVNENSAGSTRLFNDEVHCGVHVDRNCNSSKKAFEQHLVDFSWEKQRVELENIWFYGGSPSENHIVFKIDVIFNSPCKFVVKNEQGEVVIGDPSKRPENHKFRFECFVKRPEGFLYRFKTALDVYRYYLAAIGKNPVTMDNWYITDIDDFLKGNPFI